MTWLRALGALAPAILACGSRSEFEVEAPPHDGAADRNPGSGGRGGNSSVIDSGRPRDVISGIGGFSGTGITTTDASHDARPERDVFVSVDAKPALDAIAAVDRFVPTGPSWAQAFGDVSIQEALALGVAPDGTTFLGGFFTGNIDFGDGVISSDASSHDAYVASFDSSGGLRWKKQLGDAGFEWVRGLAPDPAGGVAVTGAFSGKIDFGGGPLVGTGSDDVFVARLDADGRFVSNVRYGDQGSQIGLAVAVTKQNRILAAGYFADNMDAAVSSAGSLDAFFFGFSSAADEQWKKHYGNVASQRATGVAAHPDGSAALVGAFMGQIDFGLGNLTTAGDDDVFVAYFDDTAKAIWSKRFGGIGDQAALGVAIDGARNRIAVTGVFTGDLDFGCGVMTTTRSEGFLAVLGTDGQCKGSVQLTVLTAGRAVAFAVNGDALAVGENRSGGNAFLFRLPTNGNVQSLALGGNGSTNLANAMGVDAMGNVYVAGTFSGAIDLANQRVVSKSYDAFLVKLAGAGL